MKHYRIVRVAQINYEQPLRAFYTNNPHLRLSSYEQQQKSLLTNAYVYSDSFSQAMSRLGHEAHELVYDLEHMQKTWADSRGIPYHRDNWKNDIILAQLKELKPDVVYFQNTYSLSYCFRKQLKSLVPSIRLIVEYKGYPHGYNELRHTDLLLVGAPIMWRQFKDAGFPNPLLVYHGFDDGILSRFPVTAEPPRFDFTFIGSSGYGYSSHTQRFWTLVELLQSTNLELWVDDHINRQETVPLPQTDRLLAALDNSTRTELVDSGIFPATPIGMSIREKVKSSIPTTPPVPIHSAAIQDKGQPPAPLAALFPDRCRPSVFGFDMYRLLADSRVTFNRHTEATGDNIGNMRLFEATGMGCCLLTDTGVNMADLYIEDEEVVTYRSTAECREKLAYLLEHEDERARIAVAGHRRTLRDHTIFNRCQLIDEAIQKLL